MFVYWQKLNNLVFLSSLYLPFCWVFFFNLSKTFSVIVQMNMRPDKLVKVYLYNFLIHAKDLSWTLTKNINFSKQFKTVVNRYKKIDYNMTVKLQIA